MIELPKVKSKPTITEPTKLMIVSPPKVGKTSLLASLPNSLIIDLEGGSRTYECTSIDVKDLAIKNKVPGYQILGQIANKIKEEIVINGKSPYDFLAIDTTTLLEDMANELAIKRYKETLMGKSWTGTIITNLPNGAGEGHLREAFEDLYKLFDGLANKCLILVSHSKKSSIDKNGEKLDAKDIELRGKNKTITLGNMDAAGFMRRDKDGNRNYLSFKTTETDLVTGSRFDFLSGNEFLISEKKDGKIVTYWENIFPSLKSK